MKRILATIILPLAFITAACGGGDGEKAIPVPSPSVTTVPYVAPSLADNPEFVATCVEGMSNVQEGLVNIQETAALLPYGDAATVAEYLAIAEEFVQTSISIVDSCSVLAPAEAASTKAALQSLLSSIRSVGGTYS